MLLLLPSVDLMTRSGLRSNGSRYVDLFVARIAEPLISGAGTAEAWLISFTQQLRVILPQSGV